MVLGISGLLSCLWGSLCLTRQAVGKWLGYGSCQIEMQSDEIDAIIIFILMNQALYEFQVMENFCNNLFVSCCGCYFYHAHHIL